MNPTEFLSQYTILRGVVGSTAHGLHLPGTDDRDEMAVYIEPPHLVLGLQQQEHLIQRDQPGDLDLAAYSLRKFCRLAATGNPSILVLLYVKPTLCTPPGARLQNSYKIFASRQAGHRFLGYLKAQRERLLGVRGQMRVTRTELIEKHGYDTKFAMHALRLGYQGVEYMRTGQITLPMTGAAQKACMDVRLGTVPLVEVIEEIENVEEELKGLLDTSPLPRQPAHLAIDSFLVTSYRNAWAAYDRET